MNISTKRVENFSDGVISIIITIMVFNFHFPHLNSYGHNEVWHAMTKLYPHLIAYVISFLLIGILWINHHHIYHLMEKVDEKLLWLNLHLLFWLSLIPFPTAMLGENPFLPDASAIYGAVLFMTMTAFIMMRSYAINHHMMYSAGRRTNIQMEKLNKRARIKNRISMLIYFIAIPMAYVSVYISFACFAIPPILFFIPDGIDDEQVAEQIMEKNDVQQ
jgi:uncharacterized membrane protein